MISRWYNEVFSVMRKDYSNLFEAEPFVYAGTIRGFLQPITGRLSTLSEKAKGESTYMLYTPIDSVIEPGDRVVGQDGRAWIAQFSQGVGISATGDHQEIPVELVR